jgi:hypothetical protein
MTSSGDVLLATGDATLRRYERTFDTLTLELTMWDESTKVITARGVSLLEDAGTWEVDGIVRIPALDEGARQGFGLVDTERKVTLRFRCEALDL